MHYFLNGQEQGKLHQQLVRQTTDEQSGNVQCSTDRLLHFMRAFDQNLAQFNITVLTDSFVGNIRLQLPPTH